MLFRLCIDVGTGYLPSLLNLVFVSGSRAGPTPGSDVGPLTSQGRLGGAQSGFIGIYTGTYTVIGARRRARCIDSDTLGGLMVMTLSREWQNVDSDPDLSTMFWCFNPTMTGY